MSDGAHGTEISPAGREIAATMVAALSGPERTLSAIQAVERIRAWHDAMRQISAVAEAQIMAAAWAIRCEIPDRAAFAVFVSGHLDEILTVDRAWLMAQTWDVARRQRPLRELAADRPSDAIEFVRDFVDAAGEVGLRELDENDRQVAEILAAPPRKRSALIRGLLDSSQERLALEPPEQPPPPPPPPNTANDIDRCIAELRDVVQTLDRLAHDLPDLLTGDAPNRGRRERILPLTDLGTGALDNMAAAAAEAADRFAGGD